MNTLAALLIADSVRTRIEQGDCPAEPQHHRETVEEALCELQRMIAKDLVAAEYVALKRSRDEIQIDCNTLRAANEGLRDNYLAGLREKEALVSLLGTAATSFRTGFLPPEDWLAQAHKVLGLPPTNQKCSQRESGDEQKLRRMLAFAYSGAGTLYGDDGELNDCSTRPFIDYLRMSVDEIEQAIRQRGEAALKAVKP